MAFDISYKNVPGGYLSEVGPGFEFDRGGTGDWNSVFSALAAKKEAAAKAAADEDKRRWNLEFGLKEEAADDAYQREKYAQAMQFQKQPRDTRMDQLDQNTPVNEFRIGPQGQMYEYQDPRKAALANAKAKLLGAGEGAYEGGRVGSVTSNFSSDDYRTWRGGAMDFSNPDFVSPEEQKTGAKRTRANYPQSGPPGSGL